MSESIVNKLNRNQYLNDADVNFLLTELQGFRENTSDLTESTSFTAFADETRLRQDTNTVTQHLTGVTPKLETRTRQSTRIDTTMFRKISAVPISYPLIHTTVGAALQFPNTIGLNKYGGGAVFNGSNYITIDNHSRLNPTDKIAVAIRIYFDTLTGAHAIITKGVSPTETYLLWINVDTINFTLRGSFGTITVVSDTPLVSNTWYDIIATWKSGTVNLYQGTSNVGSAAAVGTLNTNSDKLGIGAKGDGTVPLSADTIISWLTILNDEALSAWVTDFTNGILETDAKNEITTIPFVGNENPQPEASFGITAF